MAVCAGAAILPAAAPAQTPDDVAPIEGTWRLGGATIQVTGWSGYYQGTIVSGSYGSCAEKKKPGTVVWSGMTGSGFNYEGGIPFFDVSDCSSVGEGDTTWTLSNINSGTLHTTNPTNGEQTGGSFTRVGPWPGGVPNGYTAVPCEKKKRPALCPKQQKVVRQLKNFAITVNRAWKTFKKSKKKIDDLKKLEKTAGDAGRRGQINWQDWIKFKLPVNKAQAKTKFANAQLAELFNFSNDLRRLANYKEIAIAKANEHHAQQKANGAAETDLDYHANLYAGKRYEQLTPDERYQVAVNAQQVTGAEQILVNLLADAGKGASKVVFAH